MGPDFCDSPPSSSSSTASSHHVVLFPFMSKGHTIPLLQLARLFLNRHHFAVTVFTTPANRPFIVHTLSDTAASVIDLPFPDNIPGIPSGVESTDKIPFSSMSVFYSFAAATKLMQPHFEQALQSLLLPPRYSFIVSDGFLWWTLESAAKFGLPRLVFYGMCVYSNSLSRIVAKNRLLPHLDDNNNDESKSITVTPFPWISVKRNDFPPVFTELVYSKGLASEFHLNCLKSTENSFGLIFNSFYELEAVFIEYWKQNLLPKPWCVGPFCLAEPKAWPRPTKPAWIEWLDQKLEQGSSVLYVAFGSQAEVSTQQLEEIAIGLEESMVNFLWVVRKNELELTDNSDGFEERVKDRGMVVRDWVDQREILMHESVHGFLSHCGWNSVLESICAGVPILAWPVMAEQPLNAKMVVEEIKVGLRAETCDGSLKGLVKWESLKKMVKELMEGEMGKEVRKKVKKVAEMANKAVVEGGSSWWALESLTDEICKENKSSKCGD
ncbi:UDP-glycosyltransferase 90A1 [Ziziphus jujuba]|uniref:Glycosyltransferase n=1 Tax=Ziziphus jujuba TaxID=326968 RepID=A0A6P6G261_ZIZJJ|nr:UDP-glycosyltransferase 90A1 [Ziziphus jujuba]